MTDLTICQDCKVNPAIYGDGLTWARCSACQYKHDKENPQAESPAPITNSADSVEHKTISGLTSIIMPVYMVNYSLFHYTGNAVGSIREHTKKEDYEFIVVDNSSPIKPPNLQAYYADKVITRETNEGVTKAWNRGIRASFGEYVVLINNDVQVFDGWLDDMKEALKYVDLVMAYPMYSLTEPFARAIESKKIRDEWLGKPFDQSLSDFTDFACVAFKKSLIDEIGAFDEDFFVYASDVEFRDRMTKAGKKFASCKRVAIHHVSDATGFAIPETPEIMNKDKETYAKKKSQALEEQKVEPVASPNQPQATSKPQNDRLIRSQETGDKIYYIIGEKIHWITKPEALKALGFDFGQERSLTKEEMAKYERGEPITMQNVENFKNV